MSEINQLLHISSRFNSGQLTCRLKKEKKEKKISRNPFHPKWKRPDIFVDFLCCERCLKGISLARVSPGYVFSFEKDTFFLKRKEKNISLFNYPQLLHLARPPQVSFPRRGEKEKGCFSLAWQQPSLSFFSYHSSSHFYAWNREEDWKHSPAIQTMKKGDPQSFIRYEDLQ